MDTLGAVLGPLIGLAGYELLDHRIRPLLFIAIVPAVLSVLLIALVWEKPRTGPRPQRQPLLAGARELPRRLWRVTAVVVGFGLVNFPDALLLLRLNEIGFGVVAVILAYVTYNLVYALASFRRDSSVTALPCSAVFGFGLVFFAVGCIGSAHPRPHRRLGADRCLRAVHPRAPTVSARRGVLRWPGRRQATAEGFQGGSGMPSSSPGCGRVCCGRRRASAAAGVRRGGGVLRRGAARPLDCAASPRPADFRSLG